MASLLIGSSAVVKGGMSRIYTDGHQFLQQSFQCHKPLGMSLCIPRAGITNSNPLIGALFIYSFHRYALSTCNTSDTYPDTGGKQWTRQVRLSAFMDLSSWECTPVRCVIGAIAKAAWAYWSLGKALCVLPNPKYHILM